MDSEKKIPAEEPVVIPIDVLSESALEGIIKEYVLREGTEYGQTEYSFEQKIEEVHRQLASGAAKVLYDAISETCTIVLKSELKSF